MECEGRSGTKPSPKEPDESDEPDDDEGNKGGPCETNIDDNSPGITLDN